MSDAPIIEARGLNLWYGPNHALKDISVAVPAHEITAFIGPSGCGKSTFLRTLDRMNDLIPNVKITGEVDFNGENIYAPSVDVTWLRSRIGMVFQKANPFPMSIYDNIAYGPRTHGVRNRAKLDEIVERSLRYAAIWDEVRTGSKRARSAFPADSSRGSALPARLPSSRRCCSWTSPRARSTPSQRQRSKTSRASSRTATPSSW